MSNHAAAAAYIRSLLDGAAPNGAPPEAFGEYRDVIAVCVAAGLPWLPPLPHASGRAKRTHQVGVLWCDFDNGPRMTHERFEALGRARDLSPDIPLSYVSMPLPWLDASDQHAMWALMIRIQTQHAQLVVIDNLATVKGSAEENSASMAQVMSQFRLLAERTGAAIVLIHHQRKEFAARKGGDTPTRAGDRLRGHSSIEAAIDLALLVERPPQANTVTLHGTKVRGVGVPPFGAQFTYLHKPGTTELATAKFFGLEVEDQVSDHAITRAVLDVVAAAPGPNQTEVVQEVKSTLEKVGVNAIRRVIDMLEQQGTLSTHTGEHGAKLDELGRKAGRSAPPL